MRVYATQVREVVGILTVKDGMSLADREPLIAAKIAELQSLADDKTCTAMAKMMTSFQVGLFAAAELMDHPHDNLNLERWFHHQKSDKRRKRIAKTGERHSVSYPWAILRSATPFSSSVATSAQGNRHRQSPAPQMFQVPEPRRR